VIGEGYRKTAVAEWGTMRVTKSVRLRAMIPAMVVAGATRRSTRAAVPIWYPDADKALA